MIDVSQHLGLARKYCRSMRGRDATEDSEAFAEACIALINAARLYTPNKGTFATYAKQSIVLEMRKLYKHYSRGKRQLVAKANREGLERIPNRSPTYSRAELRDEVEHVLSQMDDRERRFVSAHYLDGLSYEEIGESEPVPVTDECVRKIVVNAMSRLRYHNRESKS